MEKKRKLIGILASEANRRFNARALFYVQKGLFAYGADVALFSTMSKQGMTDSFIEAECAIYSAMNLELMDGFICMPNSLDCLSQQRTTLEQIFKNNTKPLVTMEAQVKDLPCAPFDEQEGMRLIVRHLVEVHHAKSFVYISNNKDDSYNVRLNDGYRNALEEFGIAYSEDDIVRGSGWIDGGLETAKEIVKRGEKLPDAIVCCSDQQAVGVIGGLAELGIQVPRDTRVVGYAMDRDIAKEDTLITTVYRSPKLMAEQAVAKLISMLEGNEVLEETEPKQGSCEVLVGMTCGCEKDVARIVAKEIARRVSAQYSTFQSDYNFMTEDMMKAESLEDCLWQLDWYTHYLGSLESFYLCLSEGTLHAKEPQQKLTENMYLCLSHAKEKKVDMNEHFPLKDMLPALYEECDHPRAFIFTSLHFVSHVLGYVVLSYGDSGEVYDDHFAQWMRFLANSLETHHRKVLLKDAQIENETRDPVTGLYNFRGYLNKLKDRFAQINPEEDIKLRVISIDLERFSTINEVFGREEGNEVLRTFSNMLLSVINDRDICARLGNDEFVIAGFYHSDADATGLLNDLSVRIRNYNRFTEKQYSIEINYAKICELLTEEDKIEEITNEASFQKRANKENKRKHSGTLKNEQYSEEERDNVIRLLDDNLFTYQYQPIVDAKSGEIIAYEALMRSGELFKISPLTILSHADAMGRLYDIERHTFFNLLQIAMNHKELIGNRKLFINSIPKATLTDKDFEKLRRRFGSIFSSIVVEFTEQTEADRDQIFAIKKRSSENGFHTAIDDYGSGYSNISNLLTYMPDYIKVDRSLISGIHEDSKKQYFVSNIVEFAHENGFKALAEGVETSEELVSVIRLGIDLIQGYYTARPQNDMLIAIDKERQTEILNLNSKSRQGRPKKTYLVGNEEEIALTSLIMEGYTEVLVTTPQLSLSSNPWLQSDITVRIQDNVDCTLNLKRLSLDSYMSKPCIELGNNCHCVLNVDGKVQMNKSGIRVPETSSLTILGDGSLDINVKGERSYGIGGGSTQNFGKIDIAMEGGLNIVVDGNEGVGIGGGYQALKTVLMITNTKLSITATCKMTVLVGAYYSDASLQLTGAKMVLEMATNQGVGIGSYDKDCFATIEDCEIQYRGSGDVLVGIGCNESKKSLIVLNKVTLMTNMRAKSCVSVGARKGHFDTRIRGSKCDFFDEGIHIVGIGSADKQGKGQFESSSFRIVLTSGDGVPFGYEEERMSFLRCSIEN